VHELGGYATFFNDEEIGLDTRECAEDVGRTLAEMYAIAGLRVRNHAVFERMRAATNDRMSLINLLSGVAHPTQASRTCSRSPTSSPRVTSTVWRDSTWRTSATRRT